MEKEKGRVEKKKVNVKKGAPSSSLPMEAGGRAMVLSPHSLT